MGFPLLVLVGLGAVALSRTGSGRPRGQASIGAIATPGQIPYLDHQATTPVDPRVLAAMKPYFTTDFGNPGSLHAYGLIARAAIDTARAEVAQLIGAHPNEIVFTSGATESDNLAIKGVIHAAPSDRRHIVTAATEHKAVLDTVRRLVRDGQASATVLAVDGMGRVTPEQVDAALTPQTAIVSLMLANNEIGTVHDLAGVGRITRARGVLFHTDATQGVGKVKFDVDTMNVDLASLSAHKMYGPKGVGALYARDGVQLVAEQDGGGQEDGLRSGTGNVPGIVGFGVACALLRADGTTEAVRLARQRDALEAGLRAQLDGLTVNGDVAHRLPGLSSMTVAKVDGKALLAALAPALAVSNGAACTGTSTVPSHVLLALGRSADQARASLRVGLGRGTTDAEIDAAVTAIARAVRALRSGKTRVA